MSVSQIQKRRIKEEAGFRCAVPNCNVTSPLDIHHIVHQEDGGDDSDTNLICLCKNCHGRVHNGEITQISIRGYKTRLLRISAGMLPHEINFLEALYMGEVVELDDIMIGNARRLERHGYIRVTRIRGEEDLYRLHLTRLGRDFIA